MSSCGLFKHSSKTKNDSKSENNKIVKVVLHTAKSFLSTPYKLGGTDKSGIDCSALVKISFALANIELPRRSIEQYHFGKPVTIEHALPGDLVFFRFDKGSKNEIDHVGIISDVSDRMNIKFIHASTKKGVIEDDLSKPYNTKAFVKCVRIIGNPIVSEK
jgi:cell wall-associated NlpC family hydrolase